MQISGSLHINLSVDQTIAAWSSYLDRYGLKKRAEQEYISLQLKKDSLLDNPKTTKPRNERKKTGGFKRENTGFFAAFREYLLDEQKKSGGGITYVPYYEAWDTFSFLFPRLIEKKFNKYIRDTRQLKNVKFDNSTKMIIAG